MLITLTDEILTTKQPNPYKVAYVVSLALFGVFILFSVWRVSSLVSERDYYKRLAGEKGFMLWVNNDEIQRQIKSDGSVYLILKK